MITKQLGGNPLIGLDTALPPGFGPITRSASALTTGDVLVFSNLMQDYFPDPPAATVEEEIATGSWFESKRDTTVAAQWWLDHIRHITPTRKFGVQLRSNQ